MNIDSLTTEKRNPKTMDIDSVDTIDIVKKINDEDKEVPYAVEKELDQIAKAIDAIAERFNNGGRMVYCGAGTSGRLGALDAIELKPTYGVSPEKAFGIIAGGKDAMFNAAEGAEDSKELAKVDLAKNNINDKDVVIGIAASGRTPYTISALEYAKSVGALAISVTCNNKSEMSQIADISIAPIVGPEVISGSTRMKAGTAQKLVLNMISTGVMIKVGKVYQNLMINVQPTNEKLIQRAINIIYDATGKDKKSIEKYLSAAENRVDVAIVMIELEVTASEADKLLRESNGKISDILNNKK